MILIGNVSKIISFRSMFSAFPNVDVALIIMNILSREIEWSIITIRWKNIHKRRNCNINYERIYHLIQIMYEI